MSKIQRTRRGRRGWGVVVATTLLATGCSADGGTPSGPAPRPAGTEAPTPSGVAVGEAAMLADIEPGNVGSFAGDFAPVGDRLVFTAAGPGRGGLWVTDGAQVAPLGDVSAHLDETTDPHRIFTEMGGVQYFAGTTARDRPVGLWRTDATRAGTRLVAEVAPGELAPDFGAPTQLTVVGDTLYFVVEGRRAWQLWRSDGTTAGTEVVSSRPRSDAYTARPPGDLVALGDTLLFSQEDPAVGRELWASDGTADGTRLVADINPGAEGSRPLFLTAVGDRVFFAATDATHGNELWSSDGTEAGTRLVEDITPGQFDAYEPADNPDAEEPPELFSGIEMLGVLGDRLIFSADDGRTGDEPWVSDGTAEGTHLVADLDPVSVEDGKDGSHPDRGAYAWDGAVYFAADDGTHGAELWRTDGTAGGTRLVADLVTEPAPYEDEAEPGGSHPQGFLVVQDRLHFYADGDGTAGGIWRTDGTGEGTELVVSTADATGVVGEVRLGSSRGLAALGDALYFGAAEELHGSELWSTGRAALAVPRVRSVERPGITGDPVVGGTLTATPGTFAPTQGVRYSYRWFVGYDVVPGEDGLTYRPRAADVGQAIGFRVIATSPGLQPRVVRAVPTDAVRRR